MTIHHSCKGMRRAKSVPPIRRDLAEPAERLAKECAKLDRAEERASRGRASNEQRDLAPVARARYGFLSKRREGRKDCFAGLACFARALDSSQQILQLHAGIGFI